MKENGMIMNLIKYYNMRKYNENNIFLIIQSTMLQKYGFDFPFREDFK